MSKIGALLCGKEQMLAKSLWANLRYSESAFGIPKKRSGNHFSIRRR